jgi:hypothetical protein
METRRLTVLVPLQQVESLRQMLRPGEGINELLKRLIDDATGSKRRDACGVAHTPP